MILSHFSPEPFEFDSEKKYEQKPLVAGGRLKPYGLWLSDESTDEGWKTWCEGAECFLDRLKHETQFEVDVTKLFFINSDLKLIAFSNRYSNKNIP